MGNFVHLHNHSEYSLLDGFARIKRMAKKAKECGMEAVAITDHGVMYGAIEFYKACKSEGIKPIIGCEAYVAVGSRFDRDPVVDKERYHLVLLAKNETGYYNLCKMISCGAMEGFYHKPRIDRELMRQYHEGIIALSACVSGEVPRALLADDYERAAAVAREHSEIFGQGNYYLEIQNQGLDFQPELNRRLAALSKELDIPLVATNDAHYIDEEDAEFHDILLCLQTGKTLNEENRLRFETNQFYFKTEEEMAASLPEYPEALVNTGAIAARCNVEFSFDQYYLPVYKVPDGYDLDSFLEKLCREGIAARYAEITDEIRTRLEYELSVIKKMGFSGYFLIVWDMVNFAKEADIAVGPGRGSAAGSIVAYALGITNIEPLKYNLLFERFLNPSRISMPDIDIDFCYENRNQVFDYLADRYGADHVAQIVTFGTMKARLAVRDVGRVLDMSYSAVDRIAKLVPEDLGMTIEKALKQNPDLRGAYDGDPQVKRILDCARKIEGMPRHTGLHAAGLVITPGRVNEYLPIHRADNGNQATQYAKEIVEEIGLLKMDLLGLRTLTIIRDALRNIEASQGLTIDIDAIPFDDQRTYDMLSRGEGSGIFQLESNGMQTIMRNLRPETIEEITALVALYRPGPIEGGMIEDFVDRKQGRREITYDHPLLEPILKETYGVILYQEQVMQIASSMAGFSMADADYLRKAMGKKKRDVLLKYKEQFVKGSQANGVKKNIAEKIFDLMEKFAGYGFNKSHSVAYAVVAYQTAWLKANYPREYLAAMMTGTMDKTDKLVEYIEECRRLGIEVLPPDINESRIDFTVVGNNIRFGLMAVKNAGKACELIVAERNENGPFHSLLDFCERVNLNSRMLESLITAGALDSMGMHRGQLLAAFPKCIAVAEKTRKEKEAGLLNLFADEDDGEEEDFSEFASLKPLPKAELLRMEKSMLGLFLTDHILNDYQHYWADYALTPVRELANCPDKTETYIAGIISHIKIKANKQGQLFARFDLEDMSGKIHCFVFARDLEENRPHLTEDAIITVLCAVRRNDDDDVTVNCRALAPIERIKSLDVPTTRGLLNLRKNEDIDYYKDHNLTLPTCPQEENELFDVQEADYEVLDEGMTTELPAEKERIKRLYLNIHSGHEGVQEELAVKKVLALYPGPDTAYSFYKDRGTVKPFGLTVTANEELIVKLVAVLGQENVFLKVIEG